MLAVFLIFDHFVWKPGREAKLQNTAQQSKQESSEPVAQEQVTEPVLTEEAHDTSFRINEKNENITLQNEMVKITLSNVGAKITQVELKNFKMRDGSNVSLLPMDESIADIKLLHSGKETPLNKEVFAWQQLTERSVLFYLSTEKDSVIVKRFSLNDDYGIDLDISIRDYLPTSGISINFESGIADTEENLKTKAQDYKFLLFADNALQKLDMKKLKAEPTSSIGSFHWAAIRSKYFTLAIMEKEPPLTKNFYAMNKKHQVSKNGEMISTESPAFSINSTSRVAKSNWEQSFTLYLGPADYTILKTYGKGMENIAELGTKWLRWLSSSFAWFLKFLHRYIRNYGVVILIFSLLLKLVLHPLTHKQLDSSLKMQRIMPQQQEIQAKYKSDPKRMQAELSKLYKEAGTSPVAGCLPLILQMPIFFSLYSVLRYSLDMRNAHFVFWLKDLSEPDPYMVLPILMGIFMVLQSLLMQPPKQNIEQMDDKQKMAAQNAKMMTWVMPIVMFFIFRNMPAGLVLYWTVFNILSVGQQYYLMKHLKQKDL